MKRLLLLAALAAAGCEDGNAVYTKHLTVLDVTPSHGAVGVAYTSPVTASFSEPLVETSVSGTTACLTTDSAPPADPANPCAEAIAATVTWVPATQSLSLVPSQTLLPDERYTLHLTTGLTGVKSGALSAIVRASFRTIPTT